MRVPHDAIFVSVVRLFVNETCRELMGSVEKGKTGKAKFRWKPSFLSSTFTKKLSVTK